MAVTQLHERKRERAARKLAIWFIMEVRSSTRCDTADTNEALCARCRLRN